MGINPGRWVSLVCHFFIQFAARPLAVHKSLIRDAVARYGKDARISVLDFGCGEGIFSGIFSNNNYIGVDKNADRLYFAQRVYKVDALAAGNENLCFKDKVFDCVLLNSVLHHMGQEGVSKVVLEVKRVLKDTGVMMIVELLPRQRQKGFFFRLVTYAEERLKKIRYLNKNHIRGFTLLEDRIIGSYNFLVYRT